MGFAWKALVVWGALAVCLPTAGAGTLYVDDDAPPGGNGDSWETAYRFLQDALTAAVSGDEIRVAQGTYYPDRDAGHPMGTGDRAVSFTLKNGVTLAGGYAGLGAPDPDERNIAVYKTTLSGDIGTSGSNSDNSFHVVHGGGTGATALLDGLTITAGSASGAFPNNRGGGVYCDSSGPTLANCAITGNTADASGGGVYCSSASPTLANCAITGNTATSNGGGVYCQFSSSPTLTSCTINGNAAGSDGGGVQCYNYSNPTLTNCTIAGNTASGGGAVCCHSSSPTLTNCTITSNTATSLGGGVYCVYSSSPKLTNCTITGNSASGGGGVYCSSSSPTLSNCILWANTPQAIYVQSGSPVVTYCDVQGGWSGVGNIAAAPSFAFPNDSHLLANSACIDAGTNSPPGGLPPGDSDGQPRPLDGDGNGAAVADMGAYEFNRTTPTMALSATELTIVAPLGQTGSQTLGIRNSSLGAMVWGLESEALWLTAEPPTGESAGEVDVITLTADTANLAHGTYVTRVWVSSDQASNAPRAVTVVLLVGTTRHVPGEYPTIQAAIDAATPGDGVAIADGVYTGAGNKDLDFHGRAIPVRSASGDPAACIIDCEGSGRGFYFHSGEGATSIVRDLTIRNGNASGVCCESSSPTLINCAITGNTGTNGGGLYCTNSSSPTLTNCTITGNTAAGSSAFGGGVYCDSASPTLINCTIRGNTATNGSGVYCSGSSSSPTLTNCTVTGNTANRGGGVYCSSASPTLTNCTVTGNTANHGGGVYCSSASPTLTNCTITGNTAGSDGGGVHCYFSSNPTLTNCTITGNTAGSGGGGVHCYTSSNPTLTNCTITGNTASGGGAVYCHSSSPTLTNCTTTGNSASYRGGGVYCYSSSSPKLTNCTITGNAAPSIGGGVCCSSSSPMLSNCILWANTPQAIYVQSGSPVVTYCDVQGGWSGEGNIDADPGFAFPDDFHLLASSACIDAGTNSPPGGLPPGDSDGQPRPLDGDGNGAAVADMGVYELDPTLPTLAVSATELTIVAPLGQTGSQTLGIRNSSLGAMVWSLESEALWLTAEPPTGESAGEVDVVTLTANTASLAHGTYVTKLWVNAEQAFNAPRAVTVVLQVPSELQVPGQYPTIQAAIDAATIPGDEVVIADGVYTGAGNKDLDFHGRAIPVRSASGDPAACIIDCEGSGRGFYFHSGEGATSIVRDLTIRNGNASGVCCESSSPTLINCAITGNTGTNGGGLYCTSSSPTLTNCTITDNTASSSGGGVYCTFSSPTLTNCAITGNTAAGSSAAGGGGMYSYYSSPKLTNCILWANAPSTLYVQSGSPVVTYCDVQGGWSGEGNIDADPGFAFPDDFHLLASSACIDAGTNSPPGGLPPGDSDGQPRPLDGDGNGAAVADMGAYEFNRTTPTLAVSATELTITAVLGEAGSRTLGIRNSSLGAMAWSLECEAEWLTTEPAAGESLGEVNTVTLTANTAGLAHGTYVTRVWVNADQAFNAPRAVTVVLLVGTTRHVPGEYPTIQAAIDAATPGDEVVIANGTYTGVGNKDLDFHGRVITVRSVSGDPATCIIDCEGSGRGFYFHSGEGATSGVRDLTIRNGNASGVYCEYSNPVLTNCTITGNSAGCGGGVNCTRASPTLTNCTIADNSATGWHGEGGGVYCADSSPTLINCSIIANTAPALAGNGGGVYCNSSSPTLINCTIAGNTAGNDGGGVYCHDESTSPTLTNCILWANTSQAIYVRAGSPLVTYCDVQGGWPGTGNIDADPGLAFPDDPHLLGSSPCIDAGTNDPSAGLPPDDLDGQLRPLDGDGNGSAVADMGACEFNPATPTLALSATELTIAVALGQSGSQVLEIRNSSLGALPWELEWDAEWLSGSPASGESAGEADTVTLTADTAGLAHGSYVATVWVNSDQAFNAPRVVTVVLLVLSTLHVPGEYPTIQAAIDAAVPSDKVVIADGVYNGAGNKDLDFRGKAITVRSASSDPAACTIDCEGSGRGFNFHSGEGAASIVQGLTIRNGNASGVYCYSSGPALINCTIVDNTSDSDGGGVSCDIGSSPTLTNCVIAGNTADDDGGGVCCSNSYTPTLTGCTITGNTAHGNGGGVYGYYSGSPLTNCTIIGNTADGSGGGVCWEGYSSTTLTNCTIAGNTAGVGGAVFCDGSSATPMLTNCIVWGNMPQAIVVQSGSPVVTYCDVQGGWSGTGNIDADPLFTRDPSPGPDGEWCTEDDDCGNLRLSHNSLCIDAGKNVAVPADVTTDLDGAPRFVDVACRPDTGDGMSPVVDMGAYEASDDPLTDCNANGVDDLCEVLGGTTADCNANEIPDQCDVASGQSPDCNGNGVPDACDLVNGTGLDCNVNAIPDECEPDCNGNGQADECDIIQGNSFDCDGNGVPDECEPHPDCNANGIPDECDLAAGSSPDCNANSQPDECDLAAGTSPDCDADGVPDECQLAGGTSPDCNDNGVPDTCDIAAGTSSDCNLNATPDECDIASGTSPDCDANGVPDECQLTSGTSNDCNANNIPDECDIATGTSPDCDMNGVPDECQLAGGTSPDCNANNIPDECDIASGASLDCDATGIPDECEYQPDCNGNGISDACELGTPGHTDCNNNGVLDECDVVWGPSLDCNSNGLPDECDIADGTSADCNGNGAPDECDLADGSSSDANANGVPDECEACYGDLNCDAVVDFLDINAFVLYLSNFPVWQTTYAGCDAAHGDIDGNGVYPAFADINAFVTLLSTHSLPLPCDNR